MEQQSRGPRRSNADTAVYDDGVLKIRPSAYLALAYGEYLHLPKGVLFVLFEMAKRPGIVQSREELAERAWGPRGAEIGLKSVDQSVSRLRRELAAVLPRRCYIHTHAGIGYRFEGESVDHCGSISRCS